MPFEAAFVVFALVLVRLSGLLVTGLWLFGGGTMPVQMRAFMAIALALLVTPTQIGTLVAAPSTVLDLAWLVATELAVGASLGLGLTILLGGLQLAGDVIDQQAGFSLGQVFNPTSGEMTSPSGSFLMSVATAVLLAAEPFGIEERIVGGLLDTFRVMPPGQAALGAAALQTLVDLGQQSLVLAVKVAGPLIAVASLVSVALGFLGHTVPQINVLVLGLALRAGVSLLILAVTLGPMGDLVLEASDAALRSVAAALGSPPTIPGR